MSNVTLTLSLPCAVEYEAGSIFGATESDISDLSAPVFDLTNIPAGQTSFMNVKLKAPCDALTCINAGTLFTNTLSLNFTGGNAETTTDPYIVETPLLVIRKVDSPVLKGTKGQTVIRKIYIRNTRLGSTDAFTFTDLHDSELEITANMGNDVSPDNQTFIVELGPSDFTSIGDGDGLFEFNEEIVLEERILITACAFDKPSLLSEFFVSWGCDGTTCANPLPNQLAVVKIELNPNVGPILEFASSVEDPTCYCSEDLIEQSLTVVNTDPFSSASDVFISINQTALAGLIPGGTIKLVFGNDTTEITPDFQSMGDQDCIAGVDAFAAMTFTIPNIPAFATAKVFWNTLFCTPLECQSGPNAWRYSYAYQKDCAQQGDIFHTEENLSAQSLNPPLLTSQYLPLTDVFQNGTTDTIQYVLDSYIIDEASGTLNICLSIPCGLVVQPTDWLFAGQTPANVNVEELPTLDKITLNYTLPLSLETDTLDIPVQFLCAELCNEVECKDSLVTSCSNICGGVTFSISPEAIASIDIDDSCPDICQPNSCTSYPYGYICDIEVCLDTIPGYGQIVDFSFLRTNFGLPDTDDDFIPDPGDPFDLDNIRLDRAMTGDTLELHLNTVVRIDLEDTTFINGFINFDLQANCSSANFPTCEAASLIAPDSGLDNFSNVLEIYDASENQWYTCNQLQRMIGEPSPYTYNISVSTLSACGVPVNFTYDQGDSIKITSQFKIKHNLAYVNTVYYVNPRTALITANPKIDLFNSPNERRLNCDCPSLGVDVTGYGINNPANIASFIPQCESSTTSGYPDDFSINLRFGNFFPYEFRPISQLLEWRQEVHPAINLVNINIQNLSNNFTTIFTNTSLPFTISNGFYVADFSALIPNLLDESYSVKMVLEYETAECGLEETEINIPRSFLYAPLPGYTELLSEYPGTKRYTQRQPNLNLETALCDATFFNNQVNWDFVFDNTPVSNNDEDNLAAFNCWIRPVSSNGLVGNFEITNTLTNQVYPSQNGIFQIGTLRNRDSLQLQLTGINESCLEEDILFEYGWSCDPFVDPIDLPCEVLELTCSFQTSPGIIDMQPDPTGISAFLCDTMPYLEVEVFDASLGAVFQLGLEVQLPPGMSIPNGVSQMAYPAQNNMYIDIDDPLDLGNGRYRWVLTDALDTLANFGLPGVNFVPDNALSLRYKTLTDCDFLAGAFPVYTAVGEQVCKDPTNSVAKIGEPINIIGLTPPDATNINVNTSGNPGCGDQLSLQVFVNSTAPFGSADSLIAQLPPGLSYVPGSCSGSIPCEPNISNNLLSWLLPPGETSATVSFLLQGFLDFPCEALSIPFYTSTTANANCTSSGSSCEIKLLTGSRVVQVNVEKPILNLSDFTASPVIGNENLSDLSFMISNTGANTLGQINVALYLDVNGDGAQDPGDTFLGTFPFNELLGTGTSTILSIPNLNIAPEDLCKLMLVFDQNDNCSCNSDLVLIQGPFIFEQVLTDTICSGEVLSIGRPNIAGHTYQWEASNQLSCLACSEAQFSAINDDFSPETYRLILNDRTADDCILSYEYLITVQPQPNIISADEVICQGSPATLLASAGANYNWSGDGITDPNQQIQMVTPNMSSFYYVTITDDFGCQGIDSVFINVLESPTANAGQDLSFCQGASVQLNAEEQPGNTYQWTPGVPFLDDPSLPNPTILVPESQVYTLTVFNASCSSTDEVAVTFFDGLDLMAIGNTEVCEGELTEIQLTGGDNYTWTPNFVGMCQDPECSSISIVLTEDTEFFVLATTTDGCTDTISINIDLMSGTVTNTQDVSICEGSEIEIFGVIRTAEGTYCDTIANSACVEIECVNLTFTDGVTLTTNEEICPGEVFEFNGQTYDTVGVYCVTDLGANGCDSTTCLDLSFFGAGEIEVGPEDPVIQTGESVQLLVSTDDLDNFSWSPAGSLSCSDCPDPEASPEETTLYTVQATDPNGCLLEGEIEVRIQNICVADGLLIPNAFTANNNGKNDRFRVANLSPYVNSVVIEVYNRWGERVYYEEGNNGWDGNFKAEPAPEAVYLYLIKAQCTGEDEKLYKGNVTLLR